MLDRTMRALLVLSLSCFAIACGEGDTSEGTNTNNTTDTTDTTPVDQGTTTPVDMGSNNTTPADMDPGGGEDMDDPLDMDPADMAPEDMNDGDMDDGDMAPEDMGEEDMEEIDMGPPVPCAFPSMDPACPMGDYGPGTFLTQFTIDASRSPVCCNDFNGDGNNDNFVGLSVIPLARTLGFADVNMAIASEIDAGELVYLMGFSNWSNVANDTSLDAFFLTGVDDDPMSYMDNLMGTGGFHVDPMSFDAMGDPISGFSIARVRNGKLSAFGGTLQVRFPDLVEDVDLVLVDVTFTADVEPVGADLAAGGGVRLTNGELGGILLRDRMLDSMNTVARNCPCLGTDILAPNSSGTSYTCLMDESAGDQCVNDPRDECSTIGQVQLCKTFATFSRLADVQTRNNEAGYSFGARVTSVKTKLSNAP